MCSSDLVRHQPDGNFPNGVPNPMLEANRAPTIEAIRKHGADLGLAWDGDFDRCFFFDEHGTFIEGYYLVGLLAQPGARTAWLWFRVAGDALDLAALGMVESRTAAGRKRTANALALVTAITVADVLTARALMQAARPPSRRRDLSLLEAR